MLVTAAQLTARLAFTGDVVEPTEEPPTTDDEQTTGTVQPEATVSVSGAAPVSDIEDAVVVEENCG